MPNSCANLFYSRSKGACAGLSLKASLNPTTKTLQIYGMKARDILTGSDKIAMEKMPRGVRIFPQTLARYSTR